jgi:geranylgeranyl pyrophosphate synthase
MHQKSIVQAIQAAMQVAQGYVDRGLQALAIFPDAPEKQGLESLARYIVQRRK